MTTTTTIIAALAMFAAFAWAQISANTANKRLSNLRRNAFLTDERGVRVKYANASRDVRERAEQAPSEKEA